MLAMYLAVLDDRSSEEQFIDVYNTYKRLVYHTAYKIMGDSYLAEYVRVASDILAEQLVPLGISSTALWSDCITNKGAPSGTFFNHNSKILSDSIIIGIAKKSNNKKENFAPLHTR